jgi:hypothetical protein
VFECGVRDGSGTSGGAQLIAERLQYRVACTAVAAAVSLIRVLRRRLLPLWRSSAHPLGNGAPVVQ